MLVQPSVYLGRIEVIVAYLGLSPGLLSRLPTSLGQIQVKSPTSNCEVEFYKKY